MDSAIIESVDFSHSFQYALNVKRKKTGINEFDVNVKKMGWEKLEP
jgi:hypothetical protein